MGALTGALKYNGDEDEYRMTYLHPVMLESFLECDDLGVSR